jgi:hypothetical protein
MILTQAQQDRIENNGMGSNGGPLVGSGDSMIDMIQKKIWDAKLHATIQELTPKFTPQRSIVRFKLLGQYSDLLLAKAILKSMNCFFDTETEEWQIQSPLIGGGGMGTLPK